MKVQAKQYAAIVMLFTIPLTGAGVDIYVPSLPSITAFFHTSREYVQLSLTIYIFTYGICQLLFGTLSDSVGRKKILVLGILGFTVFSYLATISSSVTELLIMRGLQGAAVAAIGSTSRAMLRDLYSGKEFKKMLSYFTLSWSIGPVLSPVIGGYLQHYYNWKAPFYFLVGYGFIAFVLSLFFKETLKQAHDLNWRVVFNNFFTIFKHPVFWGWAIITSLIYAFIVIFGIIGPFLIQTQLHYNAAVYGRVAFFIGVAWMAGNFLNRLLVKFDTHFMMRILLVITTLTSAVVLALSIIIPMTLYSLIFPLLLLFMMASSIFPYSYGGPIELFPEMSGTASSAMGGVTAGAVSLISSLTVLLKSNNQIPMVTVFFGFIVVSVLIYFFLIHRRGGHNH